MYKSPPTGQRHPTPGRVQRHARLRQKRLKQLLQARFPRLYFQPDKLIRNISRHFFAFTSNLPYLCRLDKKKYLLR